MSGVAKSFEPLFKRAARVYQGMLSSELNKMGVKVFLADDKYFWSLTRGLYHVKGNNMCIKE